jgi:hypothetical protein
MEQLKVCGVMGIRPFLADLASSYSLTVSTTSQVANARVTDGQTTVHGLATIVSDSTTKAISSDFSYGSI